MRDFTSLSHLHCCWRDRRPYLLPHSQSFHCFVLELTPMGLYSQERDTIKLEKQNKTKRKNNSQPIPFPKAAVFAKSGSWYRWACNCRTTGAAGRSRAQGKEAAKWIEVTLGWLWNCILILQLEAVCCHYSFTHLRALGTSTETHTSGRCSGTVEKGDWWSPRVLEASLASNTVYKKWSPLLSQVQKKYI